MQIRTEKLFCFIVLPNLTEISYIRENLRQVKLQYYQVTTSYNITTKLGEKGWEGGGGGVDNKLGGLTDFFIFANWRGWQ